MKESFPAFGAFRSGTLQTQEEVIRLLVLMAMLRDLREALRFASYVSVSEAFVQAELLSFIEESECVFTKT